VFFNNTYYFISIVDGDLYEINSQFTTFEYRNDVVHQIPRSRVLKTFTTPDGQPGILNDLFFIVEQGIDSENTGQGNNIADIKIIDGGSDYTECSLLIEGDGHGAFATATLTDGAISSVTLESQGVGYTWAVITVLGDGVDANLEAKLNVNSYVPRADLSISYDGGYTFSTFDQMEFTTFGKYKNKFYYNGLGYGNEFTPQFRFACNSRFVCKNGAMSFYR